MTLVDQFRALAVTLWLAGGAARYRAPAGVMVPLLRGMSARTKDAIIDKLSPPANGNVSRLRIESLPVMPERIHRASIGFPVIPECLYRG